MSKLIVNEIESKDLATIPLNIKADLELDSGKAYKINGSTVLTSTQVHGKSMPSGSLIGHNDEQTLYSKTIAGFTLSGDITVNSAIDVDLPTSGSAISFDSPNKTGLLEIDTTNAAERVRMSVNLDLATGKTYRINGAIVLSSTQVLGKTLPTGDVIGTSDSQTLTSKTISGSNNTITNIGNSSLTNSSITINGNTVSLGGSLTAAQLAGSPITLDLANTNATINLASYTTTSFRIKNPAQITLSNGVDGMWYTLAIVSDGSYSFTSEIKFPLNNDQPVPSSSGRVDIYSLHCINTSDGLKYLATFAYDYSGVTLP